MSRATTHIIFGGQEFGGGVTEFPNAEFIVSKKELKGLLKELGATEGVFRCG
jgi:hypothetical protein